MNLLNKLLLIGLLFLSLKSIGQTPVLSQDLSKDSANVAYTEKDVHYTELFFGYKIPFGSSSGSGYQIRTFRSNNYTIGFRYIKKINKSFVHPGIETCYESSNFNIKQDRNKTLPTITVYKAERWNFQSLNTKLFARIKLGKPRVWPGSYIDIGASGNFIFFNQLIQKDDFPYNYLVETPKKMTSKYIGLPYVNNMYYGAFARIGSEFVSLFCAYRYPPIFTESYAIPDLPKWTVGIEISSR